MVADPFAMLTGAMTIADLIAKGIEIVREGKTAIGVLKKDSKKQVAVGLVGEEDEVLDMKKNKKQVAVLVQISQPAVTAVKRYLEEQGIDTNLFVISHDAGTFSGSTLDNTDPAQWVNLVEGFYEQMQQIKDTFAPKEYHFFFAGPATLAFAMGSKLGKWYNTHVYNYDPRTSTYYHVLDTPVGGA